MGGTIASIAAVSVAARKSTKLLLGLGWLALVSGGFLSGSRTGILGSVVILAVAAALSVKQTKHAALIAVISLAAASTLSIYQPQSTGPGRRAVSTEGIRERFQQVYFGEDLGSAFRVARGVGTGWGPYTMGIWIYADRLGFNESSAATVLEGGYLYIIAETGIVGLLFFVCMHSSFAAGFRRQTAWRWLGPAIGLWSLLGNIPLCLQEIPVLAIAWWFLTGLYWSTLRQNEGACALRSWKHRPDRERHTIR